MPAKPKTTSKQPRFTEQEVDGVFLDLMKWDQAIEEAPEYKPDTRERDYWNVQFAQMEPHLSGVIHSMISIDSNRGWTLTGGRNQVLRYTSVCHDWTVAFGLRGWRPGVATLATGFYITNLGGMGEIGRDGANGPTRQFFHLDPTRCYLTGNEEFPISYQPRTATGRANRGKAIPYREMDFVRCVSMPDLREEFRGAGWCFLSRAEILVRLMIAIWMHDMEQLGASAPRGLLLLLGISEGQWKQAMKGRKADREGQNVRFYDAIQVLCGNGPNVDAKLIALSQLPENFSLQEFINMFMYGLAAIAGFDAAEFYPVQFGSLGRGTEMEVQHEKASGKGGRNFALAHQEQMQRPDVLPEALHFEYDERDEAAEVEEAHVISAFAEAFRTMRETGLQTTGVGAITEEEIRQLYAERGLIPSEWIDTEVPSTSTDESEEGADESNISEEDQPSGPDEETPNPPAGENPVAQGRRRRIQRDILLSKPHIWRTIRAFPNDPVVRYRWPADRLEMLWPSGVDLVKRVYQPAARIKRQDESTVLFEEGDIKITEQMVTGYIEQGARRVGDEFRQLLDNVPVTGAE